MKDPWLSFRSPGYPLFLKLFIKGRTGDIQEISNQLDKHPHAEIYDGGLGAQLMDVHGLGSALDRIAYVQAGIAIFALSLLFFALARSFDFLGRGAPFIACGILILAQFFCPLWCPRWILSESLAQPCTLLFAAFLLFSYTCKKFFWLYAACCVSAYAFLVRPACAMLILLTCGYMAWLLWRTRLKCVFKIMVSLFFLSPAFLYVAQLNYTNDYGWGYVSTLQFQVLNITSLSYLTSEDVKNLPTERAKFALTKFLEKKETTDQHTFETLVKPLLKVKNFSDIKELPETLWFLFLSNERALSLWRIAREYYKELGFKTISFRELTALANDLYPTTLKNHKSELQRKQIVNFLAGLGYYPLWENYTTPPSKSLLFLSLTILMISVLFLSDYRGVLIILASIHLVSLVGIAYSGIMEYRYVYNTLFIFRLAVLVGLVGLLLRTLGKLSTRKKRKDRGSSPNYASVIGQI